ncbi:MAG: hypothetical protein OSB21_12740 [Myxococcota bacterium]|nr:hypothetical protein [Myxococcota bacterium]
MLRKIFALGLFIPLACVDTARDNPADPGRAQPDSGPGVVIDIGTSRDSGAVEPADAGRFDSGPIIPRVDGCSDEDLLPCYRAYRAAEPICVTGTCTVDGRGLNTIKGEDGRAAKELCAVACNPQFRPGLCNFNFNGSRWAVATCSEVVEPSNDCPEVLDPHNDHGGANHSVCRIPCVRDNDAENSVCFLDEMNDTGEQGSFTFRERCSDERRCTNTGEAGCSEDLNLGPYCGVSPQECNEQTPNSTTCAHQFPNRGSYTRCESVEVSAHVISARLCVGMSCTLGDEGACPPATFCTEVNSSDLGRCLPAQLCETDSDCTLGDINCVGFGGDYPKACLNGNAGCEDCVEGAVCYLGRCLLPVQQEDTCPDSYFTLTGMCRPN